MRYYEYQHIVGFQETNLIGNVYYVGASDITSYLIATPKGHIVIDGGFQETAPMILASLRVSLALSFIVMFAAEMINARSGLGHLIRMAENSLRFDLMYVSLLAIAILGYAGDRLVRHANARLLAWQEQPV